MRLLVTAAVLASGLTGAALSPAGADPICAGVETGGTYVSAHSVTACIPYDGGTLCVYRDAGADPQAHLYATVCLPAVVAVPWSHGTATR